MAEQHVIAGPARGEPLPAGSVGVRIRIPLSGTPSSHWSELFEAALAMRLLRHPGTSRLRLDRAVQGGELVLEGVEDASADLGAAVREAVDAANAGMRRSERPPPPGNVAHAEADRIAAALGLEDARMPLEVLAYTPRR